MNHEHEVLEKMEISSLDPTDWQATRRLGRRMVDDMLAFLETVRDRPVWQPVPPDVAAACQGPPPMSPSDPNDVYDEFRRNVLPYPHGNIHPRFWGWVVGTGSPIGMLADMLAAGMNSNSGFGDHAVAHVESQVIEWLTATLGFAPDASGVLTSGCSVANLTALTVARNSACEVDVRRVGLRGIDRPLRVYGSVETHSSNHRALEILGLGRESFHAVPVDEDYRVQPDRLRAQIASDVAGGRCPVAVIANAGTVNTGAFDDLNALADICAEFGAWLHVDGAFGALAALSPERKPLLAGLERADSLAFDLHKWLHVPYDCGGVLVQDRSRHLDSFRMQGDYLSHLDSGLATGKVNFMEHGVQMSRGFRALKVWMTIKTYGFERLGASIEQNIRQAHYLASLIGERAELEVVAPVPLNIVCFRYVEPGMDDSSLNEINRQIVVRLHHSGVAAPSHTVLDGRFVMRAAITNHRSRMSDFDVLVEEAVLHGREIVGTPGV